MACGPAKRDGQELEEPQGTLSVAGAMTGGAADLEGYAQADRVRELQFPEDHGPHPDFRIEWWYFTGNLEAVEGNRGEGRPFGYQLTVFRTALAPPDPQDEDGSRDSAWATRQLYLAHFALTDGAGERFFSADRLARGAGGLAGARAEPFRVWVEDWQVAALESDGGSGGESDGGNDGAAEGQGRHAAGLLPARLTASQEGAALDLTLLPGKPVVLHGDRGLSPKGTPAPGSPLANASYYFSLTRMPTEGTVTVDGETFRVAGESWMDREWSTSALTGDQVGWDWFSLQLDGSRGQGDRELMAFQLRRRDGSPDPARSGTLVAADGSFEALAGDEIEITPEGRWTSPRSGAVYPARFRLSLPRRGLDLTVEPLIPDQELDVGFRYWEGAVRVSGTSGGEPISGRGYLEMTGYEASP